MKTFVSMREKFADIIEDQKEWYYKYVLQIDIQSVNIFWSKELKVWVLHINYLEK